MRILLVNSEYPPIGGGAGRASANLARSMSDLGHEILVITSQYANLPRVQVQDAVKIERIRSVRKKVERSDPLEQISFMFGGSLECLRLARNWRPDVALAFFGVPSGMAGLLLNIVFDIPYVVSLRGGDVPGFRPYDFAFYHRLIGPFLRIIWHRAGVVVANSQGLKDLAQKFDNKTTICTIPNGVDVDRFSPQPRDWEPASLLFLGRFSYQKGLDILLHALSNLLDIPWRITLVGDGPERENLKSLAAQFGLKGRLKFVGWTQNHSLIQHYQKANLYINPSRHEGMPNAVLEAMAMGLPIVATQISGHEELVIPGENGFLIPVDDPGALSQALRDLILAPERRPQMGAVSRKRAVETYDWENVALRYQRLLEDVYSNAKFPVQEPKLPQ